MSANFDAALAWYGKGYNVVPRKAPDEKRPGVLWKGLQKRSATPDEVTRWEPLFSNGVGFITGAISGVIVIETDGLAGETILDLFEHEHGPLPETLVIRSGSRRGFHRHYRHPGGKVKTAANENIKIDVRGDGGFCVLPPSQHKSGGLYEVVHDADPAELPEGLLEFIEMKAAEADGASPRSRDRAMICSPPQHANDDALGENTARADLTPPSPETMRAALQHLADETCFEHRSGVVREADGRVSKVGWIEAGMALKAAYGDEVGFDLWSLTHEDEQARVDAPAQWVSFAAKAQPGHVTIGTLLKAAADAGFVFTLSAPTASANPSTVASAQVTGSVGDVENGKLFAGMFQDKLLYVYETGEWLLFDPQQGWVSAPPGEAERGAKEVLAALRDHAAQCYKTAPDDPKTKRAMAHVARTSDARHIRAMIEMAKSEPGMTAQLCEFDNDPMLLGVANGVLDLRTGNLLPVSPDLLVSKRCNVAYQPAATCPRFLQFLKEVQPQKEMAAFLLRLMGYCLTGRVDEQIFGFLYGHGANGKSVFIELVAWLLGDYARKIPTDMLMHHQRNPQGPSPDIVSLKGLRLAFANETEEGRRLAEARVKDLTGGDTLTGRVPYGKADMPSALPTSCSWWATINRRSLIRHSACGDASCWCNSIRRSRSRNAIRICWRP